ncbi:MAG: hypothetical protein JRN11_06305 [Nitrososphaerota archaeon]|nr:hypothetical protein [Nitrososphaerota archaeon]
MQVWKLGEKEMPAKATQLSCCGINFKEAGAYAKHIETIHGQGRLTCCGVAFKGAPEFSKHLKSAHGAK